MTSENRRRSAVSLLAGSKRSSGGYQPIDYEKQRHWGRGDYVRDDLSPIGRMLWDLALPYQDYRHDMGHAEYVVRQSLQLATLAGLAPHEREAVAAAAIDHDTGWSDIPHIGERFDNALLRRESGENGRRIMRLLRDLHQKYAVRRADTFFDVLEAQLEAADEPPEVLERARYCRARVKEIVACHDTRDYVKMPELAPFVLDGDRLAQISIVEYQSRFPHLSLLQLFEQFERNAEPQNYLLPELSTEIARLELVNTCVTVWREARQAVESLPPALCQRYEKELLLLFPQLLTHA